MNGYCLKIIVIKEKWYKKLFNIIKKCCIFTFGVLFILILSSMAAYFSNCALCGMIIAFPGSLLVCSYTFDR
jgi:hypothetical protein